MQKKRIHKKGLLILIMLFNAFALLAQQKTVLFEDRQCENTLKCSYNLINGTLSGSYVSYYNNGNKKSEGMLLNGYRTGRWIVWDSTGRKRIERVYKNPFEYTRIYPAIPNEGPIPLLIENKDKLEYDSNGIIKYSLLKAENAMWRHKFWRYLEPANNPVLFTNDRFFKLLKNLANTGKIQLFDSIDDRFTTALSKAGIDSVFSKSSIELVGYELKEEHIFDMGKLSSEYRILGICPVVKINNHTEKLFWIYYPDTRKYLDKELVTPPINHPIKSPDIKTLDDLFIFRQFASVIIKSTIDNPYNKLVKDYPGMTPEGILDEQQALELTIIEAENNIWISLTK